MFEWHVGIAGALLALLVYFAYFFKFNYIKVSSGFGSDFTQILF